MHRATRIVVLLTFLCTERIRATLNEAFVHFFYHLQHDCQTVLLEYAIYFIHIQARGRVVVTSTKEYEGVKRSTRD